MNRIDREDLEYIAGSKLVDWSRFKNKTVFVSGANGMLPSLMVKTLLYLNECFDYNVKVVAMVRNPQKARRVFGRYVDNPLFSLFVHDVSQAFAYEDEVDFIIHAASQAAPSYYATDPVGTLRANTLGTVNMLELAREKTVEGFLFFSTGAVYGEVPGIDVFLDERMSGIVNPLEVRNCYAESKRAGENACVCYHYQYNVPAKIVRVFHTFGPGINLNDGRVFSDFCRSLLRGEDIVLKSDGTAKRSFLYVADAVEAFFKVLIDGVSAEAYNVGGDEAHEISIRDLANLLIKMYPEKRIRVIDEVDENDMTYSKMRTPQARLLPGLNKIESLGWRQKTSVGESFRRTIAALDDDSFQCR